MVGLTAHALLRRIEARSPKAKHLGIARTYCILAPSTTGLIRETPKAVNEREGLNSHCHDGRP